MWGGEGYMRGVGGSKVKVENKPRSSMGPPRHYPPFLSMNEILFPLVKTE